ncbi:MAG: FecR family protein, partial [Burkholderiales bacterium]
MTDRKNIRGEHHIPDMAVRYAMGRTVNLWAICSGLLAFTSMLTVVFSPAASLAATCEPGIAKAMAVEGKVDVRHPDETQWQPVKLHDTFCPGDVIRVQERSRADIALSNQPMLRLDQNTTMTLGGIKPTGGSLIELVKGATHFFSRVPRNLEVRTAFVNAGVEGTEGVIRVTDDKTEVTIFEGKVVAANESGTLNLTDGQSIVAEKGKAPSYQTVVKPRDAVQWALY